MKTQLPNTTKERTAVYRINRADTLEQLKLEVERLKKRLFVFETLQAENEIKHKQTKGPFKNGREVIDFAKKNV